VIPFKQFYTESGWLPQNERGAIDKYSPRVWKRMWENIIDNVRNQLPSEFRRLQYVGPMPPTDAPLFSRKRSDEIRRVHLFFGRHRHDPSGRIEVQIGRRGQLDWKVLAISSN
jgi:hypothetical protein